MMLTQIKWPALIAVLLWGGSFIATKIALWEVAPAQLILLRALLALPALVILLTARRAWGALRRLTRRDWLRIGLMGLTSAFAHQWTQMVGLRHTSAIHGALLITLAPVFMFVLAALGRGEGVTRAKVAGFLIAIAGSALVVTEGQLDAVGLDTRALGGDLLLILSAGGWALYSTLGKGLLRRHPPLLIVTLTFALNTLLLLPAALWGPTPLVPFPRLSGTTWLAVLFLAWGCSALGYAMWYRALQRWDISQVSIFQYLQPLIAAVLGLFLLGETIGPATLLGGVATVSGVALVNRG